MPKLDDCCQFIFFDVYNRANYAPVLYVVYVITVDRAPGKNKKQRTSTHLPPFSNLCGGQTMFLALVQQWYLFAVLLCNVCEEKVRKVQCIFKCEIWGFFTCVKDSWVGKWEYICGSNSICPKGWSWVLPCVSAPQSKNAVSTFHITCRVHSFVLENS